jgi:type II secretory pathway pseudopilin PulG
MINVRLRPPARGRRGITLTEILIAILILGVGLTSVATLFPLGLLRMREAARATRSAYLTESAAADLAAHGLLTNSSFSIADQYNFNNGLTPWYSVLVQGSYVSWNPLTQDAAAPGDYPQDGSNLGITATSYGLPFAYDPLWRYQTANLQSTYGTQGYYLNDTGALEARFGAGIGFIQPDPSDAGVPTAHGIQRLSNFNRPFATVAGTTSPIMPIANNVPAIFVSPEDVVWVENVASSAYSPVLPDMSLATDLQNYPTSVNDWHYSWMFTGAQNNGSANSSFDGNIVIFENRPFGITNTSATAPFAIGNFQSYQVDGEIVVEGVWGYSNSNNLSSYSGGAPGFGVNADRAVLLRWSNTQPDPVVKVGDWIADVTYERQASVVGSRFMGFPQYTTSGTLIQNGPTGGLQNPFNYAEWDNLPAQRCFWYRVQKVNPVTVDGTLANARSMVVYVDRSLQARTPLNGSGQPYSVNAALIAPNVVNVIPQTIFTK